MTILTAAVLQAQKQGLDWNHLFAAAADSKMEPVLPTASTPKPVEAITEAEFEKMEAEAEAEASAAKEFTLNSPEPDVRTVLEDIYCEA